MNGDRVEQDTYWTPGRVRFWLSRYADLRRAVRYGCSVDAMGEDVGMGPSSRTNRHAGLASHLLCVKCDLDVAMKHLTEREQEVLVLHYGGGMAQRELARRHGVSQPRMCRSIDRAVRTMAARLGWDAAPDHCGVHRFR